jgi:hypothetical protein
MLRAQGTMGHALTRFARFTGLAGALLAAGLAACNATSLCKLGVGMNDPSNRSLRRSLMSYGLGQFCQQMLTRNAPLKLSPEQPIIGRFYAQHCQQQTMDNGDLWVQFDGYGYAFTELSRKVSFTNASTIQYDQDFRCADDNSVYAYFDPRAISPPSFHVTKIEAALANLLGSWAGSMADNFGNQMVASQLGQGFTVIQGSGGGFDFTLGHLPVGQQPPHPYDVHGSNKILVENLRTSVKTGERDFIGPIKVEDERRALYLTMQLEGQAAVAVMMMPKAQGDLALQAYINYGPVGPLPVPPAMSEVLQFGQPYQRALPVPPGMYYVVIDNTNPAGQGAPPGGVATGGALVNYAIQIGDSP